MRRNARVIQSPGFVLAVVLLLCGSSGTAEVIKQLPLDNAAELGTVIELDESIPGALKIRSLWPTTICLGEVSSLDIDEARLLYRARVKAQLSEGMAYLEMWCHVNGADYFSRGKNLPAKGVTDWKTLETPFFLKRGEKTDKVVLNLVIEGKGTVWVEDVTLVRMPLN
jgi:hypothetical protein